LSRQRFAYSVFHNTKAPVIPVQVRGGGRWHKVWVYVDTGASFTIFHTFEARRLGVNLKRCRRYHIVAAGGGKIPVYIKKLQFKIGRVKLPVEVGFSETLGNTFNFLGRKDIFTRFKVCFDDAKEEVTFHG
jgi:predicted aspartyl protease